MTKIAPANAQASPAAKVNALTRYLLPLNLLEHEGMTALGVFVLVDLIEHHISLHTCVTWLLNMGKWLLEHANVVGAAVQLH
ncbi:MAG: hypothetical protein MRQ09_02315 [Candidatus Midichloria sp.]|nr:hypothetical protein [Candidatus Midichloria sp.]